jgi:ATP-grasp domain, R2K clade family 3
MVISVLYPLDPLNTGQVDGHFRAEAGVVRDAGGATPLLDVDALFTGDIAAAVRRVPVDSGALWYRGWMMPSARYAQLAEALELRGASLVVTPAGYRTAHELPGWYQTFAAVTPPSVWCTVPAAMAPSRAELAELVAPLGSGPGVVKDFVKSRKDQWASACYVPDLADTDALHRVVTRFVELQGDLLAGGIVIRTFEPFGGATGKARAAEARVWWLDGEPIVVGPHPDTPDVFPLPDLGAIGPLVGTLACRFVTTDVALRDDGVWRVVEVGDGQVSDRPASVAPARIVTPLIRAPVQEGEDGLMMRQATPWRRST